MVAFAAAACAGAHTHPFYDAPDPAGAPVDPPETSPSGAGDSEEASARPAPVVVDQISLITQQANDQYLLGEEAYRAGDLDRARRYFDAAVLVFLNSGLPVQQDPRLKVAYEGLLRDVQSLEAEALAGQGEEGAEEDVLSEEIKDITSFLTPEELALEMEKIRPPSDADNFSIPVVLNEKVLTFIEAFEKQFRKAFVGGYQRMGQYEGMIRQTLREEGLPEDLIYVAFIESTFKPHAYSRARAKGMWQFMASTGARYGLVRNAYVDERSDPEKATRAAAKYLKDLYSMFGDWYLVMAAYNAGEGVVLRAIDRTGKKDYWEFTKTRHLRTETKNFVPSILALSIMSRDPERYGFEGLVKDPPADSDRVTLDGATDLGLIARLAGTSVDEIRRLNPQLTRSITPPGYKAYQVRVPKGSGESFQTAYQALPDSAKHASVRATYRVRKGDTVAGVARRFGTSASALSEANGLSSGAKLASGMTLLVPGGVEGSSGRSRSGSRGSASNAYASADGTYVVAPGDTLSDIARRHGTTVRRITDLNGISERSILMPGQTLQLSGTRSEGSEPVASRTAGARQLAVPAPALRSSRADTAESQRKVAHKVQTGDTLYRIALKYGTSVESLRAWNGLGSKSRIYPGEVLTVYLD